MSNSLVADGVELDTLAHWVGMDSNRWSVPGAKGENVLVPARHGSLYVGDKTFGEGEFNLTMHVFGDDLVETRQNIDTLLRVFTKRKSLIHFQHEMDNGTQIECYAECIGAFDITRSSADLPYAKMSVGFKIPRAFWQDVSTATYASSEGITQNQQLRLPPFEGGTAPMDDLVYLLHGPVEDPELYVVETGAFTRLEAEVPVGSSWRVDARDWTSVMGPDVTFSSTGDPSVIASTFHGGSSALMDIPPLSTGEFAVEVGGFDFGAETQLEVQGRRKYLIN